MTSIAFYALPLALLYIALTANVIRLRYKFSVSLGDGEVPALERAIRAHGNFAEFVPLTFIFIALSDYLGAPALLVHIFGATLVCARLSHGYCLCVNYAVKARQAGVLTTLITLLASATTCFCLAL